MPSRYGVFVKALDSFWEIPVNSSLYPEGRILREFSYSRQDAGQKGVENINLGRGLRAAKAQAG